MGHDRGGIAQGPRDSGRLWSAGSAAERFLCRLMRAEVLIPLRESQLRHIVGQDLYVRQRRAILLSGIADEEPDLQTEALGFSRRQKPSGVAFERF